MRRFPFRADRLAFLSLIALFAIWPATTAMAQADHEPSAAEDSTGFESVMDPAQQYFAQLGLSDWMAHPTADTQVDLDGYHTLDHTIPLPGGRTLHALETFTLRAFLRQPPRGVLLLSGSAFVANHWSINADGYNGAHILADQGYFTFAVDYLGTGQSFRPAHGSEADYKHNREAMKTVLRYIRHLRGVGKIGLVGAGYGGAMAMELAADAQRVRSVSVSAMIYKQVKGGPLTDPGFVAFLSGQPNGYIFLDGKSSLIFMAEAPQAARDFVVVTQGGFYPVDNFLVATHRPFFDPSVGRAPGMVLFGGREFIGVREDLQHLAEDYGEHGAKLVINEDAGHAPRAGPPAEAAWYWQETLAFLDDPGSD